MDLIVVWQTPKPAVVGHRDEHMMSLFKTVHVRMGPLTLTLQVFTATQAGVGVQVIETDGAYLFKVEVKYMPLYLPEVRTVPLRPLS